MGESRSWGLLRVPAWVTFVVYLGLYHLNFRSLPEVDCVPAPYVAFSLVRHGDVDLSRYRELEKYRGGVLVEAAGGKWVSKYPVGSALACVPVVLPMALMRAEPPSASAMRGVGKFMGAACSAGVVALFWSVVRRRWPGAAPMATVLLGLGTGMLSTASQAAWGHGPATLGVMVATWAVLRAVERGTMTVRLAVLAGMGMGFAMACRGSTALLVPMMAAACWWLGFGRRVVVMLAPVALWGVLLMGMNYAAAGRAVAGGYGAEAGAWTGNLVESVPALLVSPSRGLLVFTPAFVVSLLGGVAVVRRVRVGREEVVLAALGVFGMASLVLYGKWWCWWSGWSYGPRFLVETLPGWALLFAVGYEALESRWARGAAGVLVGVSVMIHVAGVVNHRGYQRWHEAFEAKEVTVWTVYPNLITEQVRGLW